MPKIINLYEKSKELGEGVLLGFPIDDAAILMYNITEEELFPFMNDENYFGKHWVDILAKILDNREK